MQWDEEFHAKWHELFGNLTPDEVHKFIELIHYNKKWTRRKLWQLREKIKRGKA